LAVKEQIEEVKQLIEGLYEHIEVYECKVAQMLHRLQTMDNFDHFINVLEGKLNQFYTNIDELERKYSDLDEKLADNISRVNQMTNELKGVVTQARSCVMEKKNFVESLGKALSELS
jgi:uncharacterized protein YoxC